jgi:hypothetical protein
VSAVLASGSICHQWHSLHIPQSDVPIATALLRYRTPRHAKSGRDLATCGRARGPQTQQAVPPHPDAAITTTVTQYLYRRCRLTGADEYGTGLERTTRRAGATIIPLKMKGSPAMAINLRR